MHSQDTTLHHRSLKGDLLSHASASYVSAAAVISEVWGAPALARGCDGIRDDGHCKGVEEVEHSELEHHHGEVRGRRLVALVRCQGAHNW